MTNVIEQLKNKHAGKTGFVIGNGPSLLMSDLDSIHDEISIASNKIFLAYPKTLWRPTYYSAIDRYVIENIQDKIRGQDIPTFLPEHISGYKENTHVCAIKLLSSGETSRGQYVKYKAGFSEDITKGVHGGECVTYFNIQLLAYMGCNRIILLGVDFSFDTPAPAYIDDIYGEVYTSNNENNHFTKEYRTNGELWTQPRFKEMQDSFALAYSHLNKKGVQLLNASRNTKLKTIPRICLDDVICLN